MSGRKPATNAVDVVPLAEEEASPLVISIIKKAMQPNPDLRYQTVEEMLFDINHLHPNDPRTLKLRRAVHWTVGMLSAVAVLGAFLMYYGFYTHNQISEKARIAAENRQEQEHMARLAAQESEEKERLAKEEEQRNKQALELIGNANSALLAGNAEEAKRKAQAALALKSNYCSDAQYILTEALGIYDLSDGFKPMLAPELSKETMKLALSPDGSRLCAICAWELSIFDTASGEKLAVLPVEESALSSAVFLDEKRIAYSAPGALSVYDIDQRQELWQGAAATGISVSADGSRIAAVYKDGTEAQIYDAFTGEQMKTVSFEGRQQKVAFNDTFADPQDNLFALNSDGSKLAVSFADGGLYVYDLIAEDDAEVFDISDYTHFEGGFSGKYMAFSAIGGGNSIFALLDMEAMAFVGSIPGTTRFRLQVDESGIYLARDNLLVQFDPETLTDRELAFAEKSIVSFRHSGDHTVIATEDKRFAFFDRNAGELATDRILTDYNCDFVDLAGCVAVAGSMDSPALRFLRLETHPETEIFSYDPSYLHSEARLSADGKTVMLFRHDRFRVYAMDGEILSDMRLPEPEQVYDQQFRRSEGESFLEVIWYDGTVRRYSASDGSLISTEQGDAPDESLYEEFLTSRYRITSPLHGTPAAYDRETGELVRELEKDAYMTYVTEVGDYIITEYTTAQGERYGLLLDQELETLAVLPDLCDVLDGRLIFDYSSGDLRETKIYSLQELIDLAGRE